ncbi:Carboxylesterase 5A [Branchiostoma belcheri]|nr:Carboxylesterase 5A [Branchiostoma belcheri]
MGRCVWHLTIATLLALFAFACGQFSGPPKPPPLPQLPEPVETEITLQAGTGTLNSRVFRTTTQVDTIDWLRPLLTSHFKEATQVSLGQSTEEDQSDWSKALDDSSIRWLIETDRTRVIQLTFHDFNLEKSLINPDCNFDYLAVYSRDKTTGLDTPIGKFCGQELPGSIESDTSVMSVVFVSDASIHRSGFNATFGTKRFLGGDLGYHRTTPTNMFGQSINETLDSPEWAQMENINSSCHPHLRPFICSLLMPRCLMSLVWTPRGPQFWIYLQRPCQSLCEEVVSACPAAFTNGTLQSTDCSRLNGTNCLNLASPQDCYYGKGQNYMGTATLPMEGDKMCLNWTSVLSYQLLYNYNWADPRKNYCRNLGLEGMQEPSCLVSSGSATSVELVTVEPCGLKPCGAIGCSVPPAVEFGTRSPVKNFHRPGEKVYITCKAGYMREGATLDYRIQLSNTLLATDRYLPQLPPSTGVVNITFQAAVVEIIDADEKNEHMFGSMAFRLSWKDNRLSWTPAKYGDVNQLVLTTKDVWTPNIYLYRNGDAKFSTFPDAPVTVTSDGEVGWDIVDLLTTTCDLEPALFPFDTMSCPVCLGTTTRAERFNCQDEQDSEKTIQSDSYIDQFMKCGDQIEEVVDQWNGKWTVSVTGGVFGGGCIEVMFARIPTFHFCATLSPPIILSILMCITFLVPTDKGDRISFGITILLSMVVSLVFITDVLPAKGSMPVVAILLVLYMCLMGIFMLITVVTSSDPAPAAILLVLYMCLMGIFVLITVVTSSGSDPASILLALYMCLMGIFMLITVVTSSDPASILLVLYMCLMGIFMLITVVVIKISTYKGDLPIVVRKVFLRYIARVVFLGDLTQKPRAAQTYSVEVKVPVNRKKDDSGTEKSTSEPTPAEPNNQPELMLSLRDSIRSLGDAVNNLATSRPAKTGGKRGEIKTEYQKLAMVLDRVCMTLYVFFLVVSIPIIRFAVGNTEE